MDEDFDLGGFDEAYDISDFGDDQAFSMDDRAPVTTMFGGGDFVDTGVGDGDSIASILNPALSSANRTNITNAGGNLVYDPAFAAALDIKRGIDPTLNLGGTGGVMVPASLRPQIPGQFMTTDLGEADMVRPMFNSQLERILQQTIPEAIKEGPVARIATGIGNFFGDLFSEGKEFAKDATAGIKFPSLKEISEGFTNFVDRFRPQRTVTRPDEKAVMGSLNPTDRFPSDMRQVPMSPFPITGSEMMNTGIANVSPNIANQANQANMEVADALQLIQPGTLADSIGVRNFVAQKLNPELKAYIDSQPSIDQRMRELEDERKERERDEQFRAEVLKSIQNSSRSQPRYVAQDPFLANKPFDSGTFIPVD